ncbi:stealth conserved region 3 domain-containing protein [Microbacterium sp. 5K110]|uniref:stealth conserved region 3 domain-containing protein n=1 Tax=unclassified Microbacterium TaxID=2609290 RepID=UPI0010FD5219|nr:stealth conserved region 3 domain-containing protein [Microbacterium sp. 5K110]TLF33587.1 sugar phosphotransferase [Microbacterium sp. 5K110]
MRSMVPLSVETDPWRALLSRADIRMVDGILHLVDDTSTPADAERDDLLTVASAIETAGVPVLLVRDANRRPKLVVDTVHADAALAALRDPELGPVYLKARGDDPVPAHSVVPTPHAVEAYAVFRPRTSTEGSYRYGSALAPRLELWRFGAQTVEAPRPSALTRRTFAAADLDLVEIERYGRRWRTVAGMFDPHPNEFTHDVDMVFSWVDGSSSDFQRQRAARMKGYVVGDGDDNAARYRQVDELRYALRSVHMYAPWVRRIFIATDSPTPEWLADHPKVTIVRSEEFFADPTVLPTHNSHAVEAQLHRIPGLAEHFLYSNDDMFFGRPVTPELFFSGAGISRFVESGIRIGSGAAHVDRSGHDNGLRVNRALLKERFGRVITLDLEHCATPLRRSVAYELEQEFAEDYARTAASRFRSASDISVTNSLYHYYALATGRAVVTTEPRTRYVQTTQLDSLRRMERLVSRRDTDMFCLNDGSVPEIPEEVRVPALRACLERYFPVAAPWEKTTVSAGSASVSSAATPAR